MSRCREAAGFLFDHPCSNPAEANCTECSKPICIEHSRDGLCIACKRKAKTEGDATDPYLASTYYYSDYESVSQYDNYSARDREAFAATQEGAEQWDKDWDADYDGT